MEGASFSFCFTRVIILFKTISGQNLSLGERCEGRMSPSEWLQMNHCCQLHQNQSEDSLRGHWPLPAYLRTQLHLNLNKEDNKKSEFISCSSLWFRACSSFVHHISYLVARNKRRRHGDWLADMRLQQTGSRNLVSAHICLESA